MAWITPLGVQPTDRLAADFVHEHNLLGVVAVVTNKSKGRAAAGLQVGMAGLGRQLDVLRIMVAAAHDDQFLDPPGHEQLPLVKAA